jgi:hypothetical protein
MDNSKIEGIIEDILRKEFPGQIGKQKLYKAGNRLNLSCPYCGDSTDHRKKRGNFYLDTLHFKCYNGGCGVFKNSLSFFKDFGFLNRLTSDEKSEIKKIIDDNQSKRKTYFGTVDISMFFENDINSFLIDRAFFMKSMGLKEVYGSPIEKYLQRRFQKADSRFAWDPRRERLFLFNLTPQNQIIGLQFRNMDSKKGSTKYLTYKLSGIWEKLLKKSDPEFIEGCRKIDPISSVFNIGTLDFSSTITIFEGPMDSWLWYNSVGLCSVENKFPFEIENIRFWYDWDKAGIDKSSELLSQGHSVFNWGKFLDDHDITKNRKWDLNDLVIHLRSTGKKIARLENYFTDDALELGHFLL